MNVEPSERPKKGRSKDNEILDKWHWRKYGQKKLKDTPLYRCYYHCGSRWTLECTAKRTVDRLVANDATTAIMYTSDHNHDSPGPRHKMWDRCEGPPSPTWQPGNGSPNAVSMKGQKPTVEAT
eukprot:TRINITY_DN6037_c0_g1_i2.p1 TRINITY_DN6037_c0_g1~~TRINITY_DN6037_c0_g1_i2.p1  ORF type:complete len:123 (-),score=4.16 TRINITY_DN6037_c0_g1_i2:109-477(-)